MKKFRTMLCAAAAAIFGLAANAQEPAKVNFTLDIDDASHVKVYVNYAEYTVQTGANPISVDEYTQVQIEGVSPWEVKSVTDAATGTAMGYTDQGKWSGYINSYDYPDKTLKVVTYNPDDARTGSFTVNVDNASMVLFMRMSDSRTIELKDGENTIKFDPATETLYGISPTNYMVPLYQVKIGEEVKEPQGSRYEITVKEGDIVDITAVIPPTPVTCTFTFDGEDIDGCISSLTANGEPVEIVDGKATVLAGQTLVINFSNGYAIDEFKVNGSTTYTYGSYQQVIMADTEFSIKAHAYAKIAAKVNISDPAAITLYRGYSSSNDVIELTAGENTIEVFENNSIISWQCNTGYLLNSVDVNDTALPSYDTYYTVAANDVITFNVEKLVLDQKAQIWINNREAATQHFNFENSNRDQYTISTGYNEIEFIASWSPFILSWYSETITNCAVYKNNTAVDPTYPEYFTPSAGNFTISIANGDVVKIFLNEEPVECNVTFTVADGAAATVVADRIAPVEDLTAAYTCFKGTELTITPADGSIVKVGEDQILPDENGICTLTVNDPATAIAVEADPKMAISEISAAANGAAAAYDLQGRRVLRPAKGLYIINGRKVLVK